MGNLGGESWTGGIIILLIIAGIFGWVVIEGLIWLFSFVHIRFGS